MNNFSVFLWQNDVADYSLTERQNIEVTMFRFHSAVRLLCLFSACGTRTVSALIVWFSSSDPSSFVLVWLCLFNSDAVIMGCNFLLLRRRCRSPACFTMSFFFYLHFIPEGELVESPHWSRWEEEEEGQKSVLCFRN